MPICMNMPALSPEKAIDFSLRLISKPNMLLSRSDPVSEQKLREKPWKSDAAFVTRRTLPGFLGFLIGIVVGTRFVTVADVGKLRVLRNL